MYGLTEGDNREAGTPPNLVPNSDFLLQFNGFPRKIQLISPFFIFGEPFQLCKRPHCGSDINAESRENSEEFMMKTLSLPHLFGRALVALSFLLVSDSVTSEKLLAQEPKTAKSGGFR